MIILDEPYVSDLLKNSIAEMGVNVLKNRTSIEQNFSADVNLLSDEEFIKTMKEQEKYKIYSNSENSIEWAINNLGFTGIPEKILLFKNKTSFRKLLENVYPDFFYLEVDFDELDKLDITKLRKPFILKPAVGFFSAGVYRVNSNEQWGSILHSLKKEMDEIKYMFPDHVFSSKKFIIEEYIEGKELAIDAYYNSSGKPVILNILEHVFSSGDDVEDKVYHTSKKTIDTYHSVIQDLLRTIGELTGLQDFPFHIEVRLDEQNRPIPIEVNPIRFAGWCTTDIAYYAYGINVHKYFHEELEPEWDSVLRDKEGKIYCLAIAKNPKDIDIEDIEMFDYQGLASSFEKTLELRKLDYTKYPVFAFIFTETREDNWDEIESFLRSDLKEHISLKSKI
ncbi:ATP-grasp domain-containing protein [Methanolobus sp. ZRKC3]|uniref:ATP-grasp domain-containing protein n=1 Tax=Methanolobus sp. ZRKC3 TaxID=3125786 RepID=UPI0032536D48